MSLVTKYSESPVKLMENQKLVEIQFPNTATEIIGLNTSNLTKIDVSKCSKDFVSTVKSSYQDKTNNKGENVQVINPNMIIEYTASAKLNKTFSSSIFGVTMLSHTFEDGKGVITFDGDVISIGNSAFSKCSGLTSITIPDSVTSIGVSAFEKCSKLTSVTIPDNVTSIGFNAFNGSGLTSIVVSSGNTVYDSRNNCNAIIKTSTNELILGCKNTIIPDGVTSIGRFAFQFCTGLDSITIPDSVTSIGQCAFQNCTGLTSINIPDSVTSIGESAFYGCSGLTSINIPDSVTSIDGYAFAYCSRLTSITYKGLSYILKSAIESALKSNGVTLGDEVFYGTKLS